MPLSKRADHRICVVEFYLEFRRKGKDITTNRTKIAILGAGNVGSTSAATIVARGIGDVCLYDKIPGLANGKAMDIAQASKSSLEVQCLARTELPDVLEDSQVVVIACGIPRSAGMLRKDLVSHNSQVVFSLGQYIDKHCPNAVVLLVTNPVDVLATLLKRRFGGMKVQGLGCALDTIRFRHFLSEASGVAVQCISGLVIGSHSDRMLPLIRHATIGGISACEVLNDEQLNDAADKTRRAGHAIVKNLANRGSFIAASSVISDVVETIVRDQNRVFSLSIYCQNEYGFDDCCVALPAVIGSGGVKNILQIRLNNQEQRALDAAVDEIKVVAAKCTFINDTLL